MVQMRVLDLFSGIGGFSLGLERAGMQTVAFCEIDKFCQKILKKHWPYVPIHEDVTKLDGKEYEGTVDLICGGFPCQPFSVAGKQKGKDDNRYLWPEMLRIVSEAKPTWFIGENVPGIINLALEQVCADLETQGYEVQTLIIPACAVNAPHKRSRTWIIAHTNRENESNMPLNVAERMVANAQYPGWNAAAQQGSDGETICSIEKRQESTSESERVYISASMAYSNSEGLQGRDVTGSYIQKNPGIKPRSQSKRNSSEDRSKQWDVESSVGRVVNGLSGRVDRLKSLGNAVVPQIPEIIGRMIMEFRNN